MSSVENATSRLAYSDPRRVGTPVLFVHGIGHNRSVWEAVMRSLPDGYRPISFDLRGHGESPWSVSRDYDLRDYASDIGHLIDRLEIERCHVVAHSLGGNAATLFAASSPDRMLGLVLVDTGPSLDSGGVAHVQDGVGNALRSYASISEFRAELAGLHPIGDAQILDRLAETGLVERLDGRFEPALDPGILEASVAPSRLVALEGELWEALRSLSGPVLLVRGGISAILSEKVAHEMVDEALTDARLVTLAESGHAIMIDDGAGLDAVLADFLAANANP